MGRCPSLSEPSDVLDYYFVLRRLCATGNGVWENHLPSEVKPRFRSYARHDSIMVIELQTDSCYGDIMIGRIERK